MSIRVLRGIRRIDIGYLHWPMSIRVLRGIRRIDIGYLLWPMSYWLLRQYNRSYRLNVYGVLRLWHVWCYYWTYYEWLFGAMCGGPIRFRDNRPHSIFL